MRRGVTLLELVVVLAALAVALSIVVPAATRFLDRTAVSAAVLVLSGVFTEARDRAIAEQRVVQVRLGPGATVTVVRDDEALLRRDLGDAHGVTMTATRDSMSFGIDGLGLGLANLSAVVTKGAVADTVVVSRLGRVRYGRFVPSF